MEKNYYDELLETIESCIQRGNTAEARQLIAEEFRMPYIPLDVEKKLEEYSRQLKASDAHNASETSYSDEEIYAMLLGSDEEQLAVINYLENSNIRNYLDALEDYLREDHNRLLKSLVIMLMISQQVTKEVTMKDSGVSYTFIPAQIEPPFLTDGYEKALEVLRNTLGTKNPSAARLAEALLLEECYRKLPLNYEEEEGEYLAYSCIRATFRSLGDPEQWEAFRKETGIREDFVWEVNN